MTPSHRRARRIVACACALPAILLAGAPAATAQNPTLQWQPCGDAPDVECATFAAPLDYHRAGGRALDLHVARVPASDKQHRIGSLFVNFGGPGAEMAAFIEAFGRDLLPELSARHDVIGLDPRSTGESEGAIDCRANQETEGIYSQPFYTPLNLDLDALLGKARAYVGKCLEKTRGRYCGTTRRPTSPVTWTCCAAGSARTS